MRRKRTRKKKPRITFLLPVYSLSCLLSALFALHSLISPPLSCFLLFPPSCTHTPVSWTFDKYLHEFRATARKLEKEAKRGQTLKFFRAIPWSVSLAPLLPLHFPRFFLDTSVLFSSYAAFSILDRKLRLSVEN